MVTGRRSRDPRLAGWVLRRLVLPEGNAMPVGRSAAVKLVALCVLSAPAVTAAADNRPTSSYRQGQGEPALKESQQNRRGNRLLTKIIVGGAVGAIVGALGSLRKRSGGDA